MVILILNNLLMKELTSSCWQPSQQMSFISADTPTSKIGRGFNQTRVRALLLQWVTEGIIGTFNLNSGRRRESAKRTGVSWDDAKRKKKLPSRESQKLPTGEPKEGGRTPRDVESCWEAGWSRSQGPLYLSVQELSAVFGKCSHFIQTSTKRLGSFG